MDETGISDSKPGESGAPYATVNVQNAINSAVDNAASAKNSNLKPLIESMQPKEKKA